MQSPILDFPSQPVVPLGEAVDATAVLSKEGGLTGRDDWRLPVFDDALAHFNDQLPMAVEKQPSGKFADPRSVPDKGWA